MNRYTLVFRDGNTLDFENEQTIQEIVDALNRISDEFITIGCAAIVQKLEIAAIIDNEQAQSAKSIIRFGG